MAREGLNKVMLIGNLGADPELTYTQSGTPRLRLRLATTERFKSRSGEMTEKTEWHSVIFWGNRAEALNKHLTKGQTVYIEGQIQYRQWEDQDGNKKYATDIRGDQLLFLDRKREGGGDFGSSDFGGGDSGGGGGYSSDFGGDYSDDDIPF